MPESLDYERPSSVRGPWYTRVPLTVLFLVIIIPTVLFGHGGRTIPGEK